MFFVLLAILFLSFLLTKLNKNYVLLALCERVKTVNNVKLEDVVTIVPGTTIFANSFDFFGLNPEQVFYKTRDLCASVGKGFILYTFGRPFYNVMTPEDAEMVFNDPNLITKGFIYSMLHKFLGTGLLTSTDKKWHMRRKLLTPAFHFNILEQFFEIFNEESVKFISTLEMLENDVICVSDLIPKFTLNNICETALGVKLDNIDDGDEYRNNIAEVEDLIIKRTVNPLLFNDKMYTLFGDMRKYEEYVGKVHKFSSEIIKKRRILFSKNTQPNVNSKCEEDMFLGKKPRFAMLDTLLAAEADGLIDHSGICEEVDTFMFEGYDTTSMGLTFSLMNLALYPDIQQKCYDELSDILEDNYHCNTLKMADYSKLKYLECFIKETLRMFPSVPFIQRTAIQETILPNNLVLPKNTVINIHIFDILRDQNSFDEPNKFKPERFFPENSVSRHPYAYVPFSAGFRNCVGQKFAMLEMKVLLVYILANYKIQEITENSQDFRFEAGLILRSKRKVNVKISRRN